MILFSSILPEALRTSGMEKINEKKFNTNLAELLKRMPQLVVRRNEKAERQTKGRVSRERSLNSSQLDSLDSGADTDILPDPDCE